MTPAARVQAAIEILDLVITAARNNGAPADRIVSDWFRTRRFAGSKDRRAVREKMAEYGFEAEAVENVPSALRLVQRQNAFSTPAFKEGLFEVQDAASQLIAPFLEVSPGMKVIDACADGGGKTLHIGALMQNKGRILALDVQRHILCA